MQNCKNCKKKLDKNHTVYCSRLCQNRYQAKYKNGFKGKHHSKKQRIKWSKDRKKNYNLSYHKKDCQCSFCTAQRGEYAGDNHHMKTTKMRKLFSKIFTGRKITWKDKVSKGVILAYVEGRLKKRLGKENNLFIDGRTDLKKIIRDSQKYYEWRTKVFERDDYICQDCEKRGCELNAHHKKAFAVILQEFLQEYNQFSPIEDKETLARLATKYKPFWDITNGKTLCVDCHCKLGLTNKKVYSIR